MFPNRHEVFESDNGEGLEDEFGCNRDLQIPYNEIVMDCGKYGKTSGIALKKFSKVGWKNFYNRVVRGGYKGDWAVEDWSCRCSW